MLNFKRKNGYKEDIDFWGKDKCFDRWWIILTRIAWCLEQASDENEIKNIYAKDYLKAKFNNASDIKDMFKQVVDDNNNETSLYELMTYEVDKALEDAYWKKEEEIAEYKENCKNEAFDLIKKYFYNLWD